jgi:hypothetical protein
MPGLKKRRGVEGISTNSVTGGDKFLAHHLGGFKVT